MVRQRINNPRKSDTTNDPTNAFASIWDAISYKRGYIQDDLEPIPGFDDWYMTPDAPVDPRDCNRYPNSPWCGGTGFSPTPIDIGFDWVADDCNFGVQACPTLAFVSLPCFQLVYRNPACIPDPPLQQPDPTDPDFPNLILPDVDPEKICFVFLNWSQSINYYYYTEDIGYKTFFEVQATESISFNWTGFSCPGTGFQNSYVDANGNDVFYLDSNLISGDAIYQNSNSGFSRNNRFPNSQPANGSITVNHHVDAFPAHHHASGAGRNWEQAVAQGYVNIESFARRTSENNLMPSAFVVPFIGDIIFYGKWGLIAETLRTYQQRYNLHENNQGNNFNFLLDVTTSISIAKILFEGCQKLSFPPPPPLPPDNDKDCCMACCDDTLLKLLYKKVDKIAQIIGVDDYPVSVPESLISKDEGFIGNLIPNPNKNLQSLTQLFVWYIERFDELMGQFEIPIEIKDADPTTPGDQPVGIKLPNVAESMAEMMGLLLEAAINSRTLVNITTRNLIGSEQDKLQNYKTYMAVQAIVEYLGFKHKDTKEKIPMLITPDKESLEELLQEKELEIEVTNFDDKQTFRENLADLLNAAAIIRAVFWRKIDKDKDIAAQLVEKVKKLKDVDDALAKNTKDDDELDKFIADVEDGFRSYTNITDPLNPYGKPYEERPKIKKIGDDTLGSK